MLILVADPQLANFLERLLDSPSGLIFLLSPIGIEDHNGQRRHCDNQRQQQERASVSAEMSERRQDWRYCNVIHFLYHSSLLQRVK